MACRSPRIGRQSHAALCMVWQCWACGGCPAHSKTWWTSWVPRMDASGEAKSCLHGPWEQKCLALRWNGSTHTHAHTYMYNIQKHTIWALYMYTDANVIYVQISHTWHIQRHLCHANRHIHAHVKYTHALHMLNIHTHRHHIWRSYTYAHYTHAHMCTHTYTLYIHTYAYVYVHTYTHEHTYIQCTIIYACAYYIHTCILYISVMYMHTHIEVIYIYTHAHTQVINTNTCTRPCCYVHVYTGTYTIHTDITMWVYICVRGRGEAGGGREAGAVLPLTWQRQQQQLPDVLLGAACCCKTNHGN